MDALLYEATRRSLRLAINRLNKPFAKSKGKSAHCTPKCNGYVNNRALFIFKGITLEEYHRSERMALKAELRKELSEVLYGDDTNPMPYWVIEDLRLKDEWKFYDRLYREDADYDQYTPAPLRGAHVTARGMQLTY